jgi:amino acid permease
MSQALIIIFVCIIAYLFHYKKIRYAKIIITIYPFIIVFLIIKIYYGFFWNPAETGGAPMEILLYPFLALPSAVVGILAFCIIDYLAKKK